MTTSLFAAVRATLLRLAGCLRKRKLDEDLQSELESHLQFHIDDNLRIGMSPADARRDAMLKLGGLQQTKESYRDGRSFLFLQSVLQDLRYGLRTFRKSPGFSVTVIVTLGIGIGMNSAIFSILNGVMLKTLPVEKPTELHAVRIEARTVSAKSFSYPEFRQLSDALHAPGTIAAMSHVADVYVRLPGKQTQDRVAMQLVSGEYFPTLGVSAIQGRTLTMEDNGKLAGDAVAVISANYWHRQFGGAANVIGQGMYLNGAYFTIVGVSQSTFGGVWMDSPVEVWVPLEMQAKVRYAQNFNTSKSDIAKPWLPQEGIRWLDVIVRAGPGSKAMTEANLNATFQQWVGQEAAAIGSLEERKLYLQRKVVLAPFSRGFSKVRKDLATPLVLLMVLVGLVLLVACSNIANLLLARSAARRREIALRLSAGAGRTRLIRQLMTESLLLSCAGASLGLLISYWGTIFLVRVATSMSDGRPIVAGGMDANVLAFTAVLAVATAIFFGLTPAFRMTRVELNSALANSRTSSYDRSRLSFNKALVISQVSLSLALVVGAGLFARSLRNQLRLESGFDQDHLLTVQIDVQSVGYTKDQWTDVFRRIVERVNAVPGVRSSAVAACGLLSGCQNIEDGLQIAGYQPQPGEQVMTQTTLVGPEFFSTVGLQLIEGRTFDERDTPKTPLAAVVNEAMVRRYFPARSAIGQRFGSGGYDREIVGVVRDARASSIQEPAVPTAYYSLKQFMIPAEAIEVRTAADPRLSLNEVRNAIAAVDPNLPIRSVTTLSEQITGNLSQERLVAFLTSMFGGIALALSCFGLYGVMSYGVTQRTTEFGIRMALGASPWWLISRVLLESLTLVGAGVALGLPLVFGLSKLISGLLFGLTGTNPLIIVTSILILLVVASIAASLPAYRTAMTEPNVALRYE